MGIEVALIGGALGLAGSAMSSRAQSRAAGRAADATRDASREQIALQRQIYNQQRQDMAPFREQELQRANALGEVFGFSPVGDGGQGGQAAQARQMPTRTFNPQAYLDANPDVRDVGQRYLDGGNHGHLSSRGYGSTIEDYARFHADSFPGAREGGYQAFDPQTLYKQPDAEPVTMQSQQDAARGRFEGSMFNDVYRQGHARDVTRIDSGLASQGLAFSGARTQAVEDARADRFGSTFNSYMASLMGQAPQTATANTANAGSAFAAGAGNAIAQRGAGEAQSAYARGQANAGLWNGVAGLGGFAMGGGFSGFGKSGSGS